MPEYSDAYLRDILKRVKSIAMVGVSTNSIRPSYFVARYLALKGYEIYPVNPAYEGQEIFGRRVYHSLNDLPVAPDMVDIFRRSEFVPEVVDAALVSGIPVIWMQIGVIHQEAAERAAAAGADVVMDRCPKIEHQRLFGELRKGGFATGVISSKL